MLRVKSWIIAAEKRTVCDLHRKNKISSNYLGNRDNVGRLQRNLVLSTPLSEGGRTSGAEKKPERGKTSERELGVTDTVSRKTTE